MQRSYSHVGKYPTQVQCFTDYGVLKREKQLMIYEKYANMKYKYGIDISGVGGIM